MKNKKRLVISLCFLVFILGVSLPLFITNHKKVKADTVTDLTNTTWIFNNSFVTRNNRNYNINFISNNNSYTTLNWSYLSDDDFFSLYYNNTNVYYYMGSGSWTNDNYKTISITGGTDATNSDLILWLQNNATQQPTGTQITHKYWSIATGFRMQTDEYHSDNSIQYTVLFNEQRRQFDETTQTGLVFKGPTTEDNTCYMWAINGSGINLLYRSDDDRFLTACWFEFTPGDYINTDLYDFMSLIGHWFDDEQAYLCGTSQGYAEGFELGRSSGQADGVEYTNLISGIFNGLGDLLSIQVFPNITIALIIGLPLLLGVLIIIIKLLRG